MAGEDEERLLKSEVDDISDVDEDEIQVERPARSQWSRTKIAIVVGLFSILIFGSLFLWSPWKSRTIYREGGSPITDDVQQSTPTYIAATPTAPSITHETDKEQAATGNGQSSVISPPNYILSNDWVIDSTPVRREYEWIVTDVEFNPDGVYRPMTVINNQFPGPLIRANEDDTIVVRVKNQATNATSFHWHGIYQNGTAWMDGSVGVSQCPIPPGGEFTYEFKLQGQYGTYWYHAHQGAQASDGLVGPLVIHSKKEEKLETIFYDTDQVVMVSDHYHNLTSELMMKYLASDAENAEPVPNGALINGRGMKDCSKYPGWKCDSTSPHVGYPKFELAQGKAHKLRFINVGAFAEFQIAIDEHNFAVVEVDGTAVTPKYYDRFTINSAQRYSIVVFTNKVDANSWWLRAKMLSACFTDAPKNLDAEIRAVITTNSADTNLPVSKEFDSSLELICKDMNTTELHPAEAIRAPDKADSTFYLRANFEIGAWRLSRGMFNSSSWRPDIQRPTLHRVIDGLQEKNASFGHVLGSSSSSFVNDVAFDTKKELVIQSTGIQVIDLIITNFDDGNHPLHLHGYKFFLMGQGHGYYDAQIHKADTTNPLRRDTASVEAYGWLWIRIVADNPGAWPFHCHITWHTEAGLLMQLVTRTDSLDKMSIPQANRDLCSSPKFELAKGGTPEDQAFYGSIG